MAIAFTGATSVAATATNYTVAWPASSVAAGRIAFLFQITKGYTEGITAVDSGLSSLIDFANGTTANGADAGSVRLQVYYKVLNGSESGSISVTNTCNVCLAILLVYENSTGAWLLANTTANATARVGTGAVDPGLTAGDYVLTCLGMNGDVGGNVTTFGLTATGITVGTETTRRASVTNTGFDAAILVADHVIDSGSSVAAPVLSWTTGQSAGPVAFIRLREDPGSAVIPRANLMLTGVGF